MLKVLDKTNEELSFKNEVINDLMQTLRSNNINTNFIERRIREYDNLGFYDNLSDYGLAKHLLYIVSDSVKNYNLTIKDVFIIKSYAKAFSEKFYPDLKHQFKSVDELYNVYLYRFINEVHQNLLTENVINLKLKDKKFLIRHSSINSENFLEIFKQLTKTMVHFLNQTVKYDLDDLTEIFKGSEATIITTDTTTYRNKRLDAVTPIDTIEVSLNHQLNDEGDRFGRLESLVEKSKVFKDFNEFLGVKIPFKQTMDLYVSYNTITIKNKNVDKLSVVYQKPDNISYTVFTEKILAEYLAIFDINSMYYEIIDLVQKASKLTYKI